MAGPGPSSRRAASVLDSGGRDGLDWRRAFAGIGGRGGRSRPGGVHQWPVRRGPGSLRAGHRARPLGRHPPLRRGVEPVPAPTLPRGPRTLRASPRSGRRRAFDQDRLRPGQYLSRDGGDFRGRGPLRRLPGLDPPRRGLRRRPARRLGQPGVRGGPSEATARATGIGWRQPRRLEATPPFAEEFQEESRRSQPFESILAR